MSLDRAGTIYYVVAPYDRLTPVIQGQSWTALEIWQNLPVQGQNERGSNSEVLEYFYKKGGDKDADKLTISQPDDMSIIDPKVYGSVAFNYPSRNQTETLKITGLMPRTKYVAYFVLKGSADTTSQVFAYAFETSDVSKPKITLEPRSNGSVKIGTHVPSYMSYRLFTASGANKIKWLKDTKLEGTNLATYTDDTGVTKTCNLPTAYASYGTGTTKGTITVWDALMTEYTYTRASDGNSVADPYYPSKGTDYDGYSVFDIYANPDLKRKVAAMIRDGDYIEAGADTISKDGPRLETKLETGTGGNTGIKANYSYVADMSEDMELQSPHVLFTVGHHTSSEMGPFSDSFRAVTNVVKLDQTPPELLSFSVTIDEHPMEDGRAKYSGTFVVSFNKSLYWQLSRDEDPTGSVSAKPVYNTTQKDSATEIADKKYIAITEFIMFVGGQIGTGPKDQFTTSTFSIPFTNLYDGAHLELFSRGDICNANGGNRTDKLTIDFKDVVTTTNAGTKVHTPTFEAKLGTVKIPFKTEWVETGAITPP